MSSTNSTNKSSPIEKQANPSDKTPSALHPIFIGGEAASVSLKSSKLSVFERQNEY
jgi:hypothetical protein